MNRVFLGLSRVIAARLVLILALLVAGSSSGADAITNIMSPLVSYQYPEDFSSEVLPNGGIGSPFVSYQYLEDFTSAALANGGIVSPFVSYQYFEWPGDSILHSQSSQFVSYYYQVLDAPPFIVVPTARLATVAETTPMVLVPPPQASQLNVFHDASFVNTERPDPLKMTVVLTHGWIPTVFGSPKAAGIEGWPTDIGKTLTIGANANIVAWDWKQASESSYYKPGEAAARTPGQGIGLGQALMSLLGPNYSHPIHFVGHSLGTLVNAYAANFVHGDRWTEAELVAATSWPSANTHMTLFDEAEAATDITSFWGDVDTLAGWNGNPLLPKPSYYHPLPKRFVWADNYISAFGLLQPGAANLILTNGLPTDAPDLPSWWDALAAFHSYPIGWYKQTIQTDIAPMGFRWSFERGGWFAQAPAANSVYVQAFVNSQWDLTATSWNDGTDLLAGRFQEYRNSLAYAITHRIPDSVAANGTVTGEMQMVGAAPAFDSFIMLFLTGSAGHAPGPHPLDGGGTNTPAYAWIQLNVPAEAVSMSFDFRTQGNWEDDSLAAALNGTNVLLLAGSHIETNVLFSSGRIDVSPFAGQTNEFFIGIVGGTSTNAQLTVMNLVFYGVVPPFLNAQASGDKLAITWPLSAGAYSLEASGNLVTTNSWTGVSNVPSVVELQNEVTNQISPGSRFYRLRKTH